MSTLGEHTAKNPVDLSRLDGITDPQVFNREYHEAIRDNLRTGGFLPPTEGVTQPTDDPEDTGGFFDSIINKVFAFKGSDAFDKPEDQYTDKRFDFIAGSSRYSEEVVSDRLKRKKIGYDFNLDDPELRKMAKNVLGKSDAEMEGILKGTTGISSRDARVLYEARISRAERFVKNHFEGIAMGDNQRMALVSLAYQNEQLIGPNLTKLVKSGDWEGAADEIRNRSNKYKIDQVADRRNREADLFLGRPEPVEMNAEDAPEQSESFSLSSLFGFGNESKETQPQQAAEMSQEDMEADPLYGDYLTGQQLAEEYRKDSGLKLGSEAMLRADGTAVGTMNDMLGFVPAHVRMLIEDVAKEQLGIDKTDDIKTSDFFTDDELIGLIEVVKRSRDSNGGANSGVVEYTGKNSGYEDGVDDVKFAGDDLSLVDADASSIIKKTLGQFSWEINDEGELIVTDDYDFNDGEKYKEMYPSGLDKAMHLMGLTGKFAMGGLAKMVGADDAGPEIGLYGIVRRAAALYGSSEGDGMSFKINLGKVDFDKVR
jgi:hypothetical protein